MIYPVLFRRYTQQPSQSDLAHNWFRSLFPLALVCAGIVAIPSRAAFSRMPSELQLAQVSSVLDGGWRLTVMGEPTSPGVVPQDIEMTAEFEDDRIFGSGGCNRFMGSFETDGEELSIGPLASTSMACEESVMNQEMRYLMALEGAQQYEVTEQGLSIFYETEEESGVLRFVAQSELEPEPAPTPAPSPTPTPSPTPSPETIRGLW
jgi:heat shock protein HslJ